VRLVLLRASERLEQGVHYFCRTNSFTNDVQSPGRVSDKQVQNVCVKRLAHHHVSPHPRFFFLEQIGVEWHVVTPEQTSYGPHTCK
jgi:hypothetical protein